MCINIGALIGGVLVPLMAQHNVTIAYFLPVAMLALGVALFSFGTSRYVRTGPKGDLFSAKGVDSGPTIDLGAILRISILIIPFCIAYSQMATTFIVQGTVMKKAFGIIDAACMNNADAVSCFSGARHNICFLWCLPILTIARLTGVCSLFRVLDRIRILSVVEWNWNKNSYHLQICDRVCLGCFGDWMGALGRALDSRGLRKDGRENFNLVAKHELHFDRCR